MKCFSSIFIFLNQKIPVNQFIPQQRQRRNAILAQLCILSPVIMRHAISRWKQCMIIIPRLGDTGMEWLSQFLDSVGSVFISFVCKAVCCARALSASGSVVTTFSGRGPAQPCPPSLPTTTQPRHTGTAITNVANQHEIRIIFFFPLYLI